MDCRVKTFGNEGNGYTGGRVSILDLMDCRVKTRRRRFRKSFAKGVSILDLMDCRVKTMLFFPHPLFCQGFNP